MKPFFSHIRFTQSNHKFRGVRAFTMYIQENKDDHRKIDVGIAKCSGMDQFEKAIGRSVAQAAERTTIYKRDLPKWLSEEGPLALSSKFRYSSSFYNHLLRNFV